MVLPKKTRALMPFFPAPQNESLKSIMGLELQVDALKRVLIVKTIQKYGNKGINRNTLLILNIK